MKLPGALFRPNSKIKKKSIPKKIPYISGMELSESKIKKFLIFSQKKAFLIYPGIEPCSFQPKLEK